MATDESKKIKSVFPKAEDDVQLPELPQWTQVVGRPGSLNDLDPDAQTSLDDVEATFLTLGDLAYLDAITETEITDNSISTPKLQAGSVEASKMNVGSLSAISADMGTITAGTITGAVIQTATSGYRLKMDGDDNAYQFLSGATLLAELVADIVPNSGTAGAYLRHSTDNAYMGVSGSAGSGWAGFGGSGGYFAVTGTISDSWMETNLGLKDDWDPEDDDTFALGSSSKRWEYLHISEGVRYYEPSGSSYVQIDAPSLSSSWTLTLPPNNGSNGQVLTTDGSGDTTWEDGGGGFDPSSIGEDMIPASANAYDLGSASNYWAGVYCDDLRIDSGGNIYYNGALFFDFGTAQIWTGTSVDDISPSSTLGCNLGDDARFNLIRCDTLDELSDIRVKKNIKPLQYGLDAVNALETITYNLKKSELPNADASRKRLGFSAQQVATIIPEIAENCEEGSEIGSASLRRIDMIPVLVKAIQELSAQVVALSN